jgi:hypothetical protein
VSVQTGIAPQQLLELDGTMFDALVTAAEERWPVELELQAQALEVASAHLLAFVRAHTKPGTRLPAPISADAFRPASLKPDESRDDRPRVSIGELAALPGLSAELRGAG